MPKSNGKRHPMHGHNRRPVKPKIDPIVRQVAVTISFMTAKELHDNSYLSMSTCYNILRGRTKRPQHLTVVGLLQAAGFGYELKKRD